MSELKRGVTRGTARRSPGEDGSSIGVYAGHMSRSVYSRVRPDWARRCAIGSISREPQQNITFSHRPRLALSLAAAATSRDQPVNQPSDRCSIKQSLIAVAGWEGGARARR
eukprot:scaffold855_cov344-Prasinococcus_capsulatus_cf.AAC.20